MSVATSRVVFSVGDTTVTVSEEHGLIPWSLVLDACSFNDALLARELYPDLVKELATGATKAQIPLVRLMNPETRSFPVGLTDRVVSVLKEQGVSVELKDTCSPPSFGFKFEWQGPDLRAYQKRVIQEVISGPRHGIVVVPTGAGKTAIASYLIAQIGVRTLWIVHSADLVRQTAEFLYSYLGIRAGQFGAGNNSMGTVVVTTNSSLGKFAHIATAHEWSPGLVIVDEAHRTSYRELMLLQNIHSYYRYALTATPFRTGGDQLVLEATYGNVTSHVSISELQASGLMPAVSVETIVIPIEEKINLEGASWEEVYKPGIVRHEGRNQRLKDKVVALVEQGHSVLVDVEEIDHIECLGLEQTLGSLVASVRGSDLPEERANKYKKFREGSLRVLIGTVLKEGLDLPTASAVVLAGGKKSKVRLLQEIGRGLRHTSSKSECIVVDTIDHQHYLLFQHSQQRLKTMVNAGFSVPEGSIRQVLLDQESETDKDIEKLRQRQGFITLKTDKKKGLLDD